MGRGRARLVWSGVDTLELSSRAPLGSAVVERLRALRAIRGRQEVVTYAGETFRVERKRGRLGAIRLVGETMTVAVRPDAQGQRPRVVFEIGALALACHEADAVVERARAVLACLSPSPAGAPELHVSRIDLAADVQGWTVRPTDLKRFCTRARRIREWDGPTTFTGFTFGKGAIQVRIYDKIRKSEKDGEAWQRERWTASPRHRPGAPVWRVEFQLRREGLMSHALTQPRVRLDTWEQVRPALRSLWTTLTERWLSYRLPRTGKSRRRYAPAWREVMDAFAGRAGPNPAPTLHRVAQRVSARSREPDLDRMALRETARRMWLAGDDRTLEHELGAVLDGVRTRVLASPGAARNAVTRHLANFRSGERGGVESTSVEHRREGGWAA